MKKILFAFALLGAVSTQLQAQKLRVGVTAGLNLSTVSLNNSPVSQAVEGKNQGGWFFGVKAELPLILGLGVDGALVYNQRKYSLTGTGNSVNVGSFSISVPENLSISSTFNTVDIPLNLRYGFSVAKVNVFVATGPEVSLNVDKSTIDLNHLVSGSFSGSIEQPRVTAAWNYAVGARFSSFEVSLGYNQAAGRVGEGVIKQIGFENVKTPSFKVNSWRLQATYYF